MKTLLLTVVLCLAGSLALAAPAAVKPPPKPLIAQVQRLTELLRDSSAVGYPEAAMVQMVKLQDNTELALTIFTIEGYGGGNNHTQYLAAFSMDAGKPGKQHFMLVDVIPVGGKSWRSITNLNARISQPAKSRDTTIIIDAMQVSDDDSPNFPSKKTTIHIQLKDGRLIEQKKP